MPLSQILVRLRLLVHSMITTIGSRAVALPPPKHRSAESRPSYLPRQPIPKPLPRSIISSKIPFAPKEPVQQVEGSFLARGLVLWRVKVIFDGQLGLSPEAYTRNLDGESGVGGGGCSAKGRPKGELTYPEVLSQYIHRAPPPPKVPHALHVGVVDEILPDAEADAR